MQSQPPCRRAAPAALALAVLAATAAGCTGPAVGPADTAPPPSTGYRLTLTAAHVDADLKAVVDLTLTHDGAPVPAADLPRLLPSFTLAALLTDPVSGLPAWQGTVLTGARIPRLPLGGPGTPPGLVLSGSRQPGAETGGTFDDLGGGAFRYTYATALPAGFDLTRTFRAGAWLAGVPGAEGTAATLDFAQPGVTVQARDTVLDASCNVCHGRLTAHGGFRSGVKLCLTCHTIQNADPETADPAALVQALTANPVSRTVLAGTGPTSVAASLRHATSTVAWTLSPGAPGTLSAGSGAAVTYTPPASVGAETALTLTASAAGFTWPVALTVRPPAAPPPPVAVSPVEQALVAHPAAPVVRFTALLSGVAGPATWSISPPSGAGTILAAGAAAADWTPPGRVEAATTVTITATAGGQSGTATVTLLPNQAGSATPDTDPNPMDLGRLVHRIHRGKKLPTLFLASSRAPAPALPSATPLPLPYVNGRNPPAPGAEFKVVGFRSSELKVGRVVTRTDNGQPGRLLAEGIGFPRDLRDCAACHAGAPQAAEVVTAISRRTCQGCHPDVWYGADPITDLVHLAHPGGPQADDARCAECHIRSAQHPDPPAPHDAVHLPPALSTYFNEPVVEIVGASGLRPGEHPVITFTVRDRVGPITDLANPQPPLEPASAAVPTPSPVPRSFTGQRIAFLLGGPASDVLTGNVPFQEAIPNTLVADAQGRFTYTFAGTMPAGATGTWALSAEARRVFTPALTSDGGARFNWPYTGEAITEFTDNPVLYVDVDHGAWPGGLAVRRRSVVERARCEKCHQELSLHGGLRHNPDYCVMCHTADNTDWNRRPKGPGGNVNLGTVYSDTRFGTYDGIEERSIHLEVMVHRIHTGEGQGRARLELGGPHVIYGFGGVPFFFDDIVFPNRLADCTLCHADGAYLLERIPAGTPDTVANETATIQHAASLPHAATEPRVKPLTAACNGCHGTAFAAAHAAQYTTAAAGEQCLQCHGGSGALGVRKAHGLP
jgi:OmcA/MtrC family decaheme c-type cytochrome